jgi:hypothetical protein
LAELEPVVKAYEVERERAEREETEHFDPSGIALTAEERRKRRVANG